MQKPLDNPERNKKCDMKNKDIGTSKYSKYDTSLVYGHKKALLKKQQ